MSDDVLSVVGKIESQIVGLEEQITHKKRMVNDLLSLAGQQPRYGDVELEQRHGGGITIRSDQFHGQPLATAVRNYLEVRRAANFGPAKVTEIYDALVEGGYVFETKNAANAKRGLRISLTKNPAFYRLPGPAGAYGLRKWYPTAMKRGETKEEEGPNGEPETDQGDAAEET